MVFCIIVFSSSSTSQPNQAYTRYVTYGQIIKSLEEIAQNSLEKSETIRREFKKFHKIHGMANEEAVYREFVRVRLAFEATRDSGLWQLRWAVTNKEPNSDSIWMQWHKTTDPSYLNENEARATAVAECDELSALFAFISKGLGVKNVGLYWPTWNHTVAVWTTKDESGNPLRIVVPTSQVFISANATLGTTEFNPYKQKTIYNYTRNDIRHDFKVPSKMAEMMIHQVRKFASKSSTYLQERRNRLSAQFGGS